MKEMRSLIAIIAMVSLALAVSCEHKKIVCPAPGEINVVFEWDSAPAADVEGMTLFFYPLDEGGRVWRFDIAGSAGGQVMIPSGRYELIACNNDLPGIRLENTGNSLTIAAAAGKTSQLEDGIVYAGTGMLYSAKVGAIEVTPCGVSYMLPSGDMKECGRRIIRCSPDSVSTLYTVMLTHVSGMERLRSASVALEGVHTSVLLNGGIPAGHSAAVSVALDSDGNTLSGKACAFAPVNPASASYRLLLRVVCTDGSVFAREIGVKPENIKIPSPRNVIITVDGIEIPDKGTSGDIGGIDAVVDGWESVEIDLSPSMGAPS